MLGQEPLPLETDPAQTVEPGGAMGAIPVVLVDDNQTFLDIAARFLDEHDGKSAWSARCRGGSAAGLAR